MKRLNLAAAMAGAALALALTPLALTPAAFAHTAVQKTSIADKAHLNEAPENFTVTMADEAVLVSVRLTDASGKDIALEWKPARNAAKTFAIPLPALGDGSYRIAWKIMAKDGHVMDDAVSFMIMKH